MTQELLMPWASQAREKLQAFARDPAAALLFVRSEPELERAAARFVASLDDDPEGGALVTGVETELTDAAGLAHAIVTQIRENLECHLEHLHAHDRAVLEPIAPAADVARVFGPMAMAAHYAGRVGRGLGKMASRLIVAVKVTPRSGSIPALREAVQALARHSAPRMVKFVFFEPRRERLFDGVRTRAARVHRASADRAVLDAFLRDDAARGLIAGDAGDLQGRLLVLDQVFSHPAIFAAETIRRCRHFSGAHPDREPVLSYLADDARRVADAVEHVALARGHVERPLVVLLAPMAVRDRAAWRRFVSAVLDAAVAPFVKYLIADAAGDLAGLAPARTEQDAPGVEVHLGPDLLRSLLAQDDDEAPAAERARNAILRAGFAIGDNAPERAVEHAVRALKAAEEAQDRVTSGVAWLAMAGAFYRARDFARARSSYAKCATIALEQQARPLAAQALVGMGHAELCAKRHHQAALCYGEAAKYCDKTGNPFGAALALIWLGESHRARGELEQAGESLSKAAAIYEATQGPLAAAAREGLVEALARLERVRRAQGRRSNAEAIAARVRELGGGHGLPDLPGGTS